tara:strand:- start:742 stop:1203 length:462 start_codon:yes stop_codon:yes gene_type:complete
MKKTREVEGQELLFTYFNEMNIISQLSSGIFSKTLPEGLTNSQFNVLNWFVRVDDVANPGRLSTAFQVTKGAMTNTLKKLQEKHFITVEQDQNSGRKKIVRMTPQGRKVRDQAIRDLYPLFNEFAGEFDISSIQAQLGEVRKVRKYLDEYRYR